MHFAVKQRLKEFPVRSATKMARIHLSVSFADDVGCAGPSAWRRLAEFAWGKASNLNESVLRSGAMPMLCATILFHSVEILNLALAATL